MKNMQPLDVTPILGSAPSSPTSLNVKLSGSIGISTGSPSGPVTNLPVDIMGSSCWIVGIIFPKQPENPTDSINIATSNTLASIALRKKERGVIFLSFIEIRLNHLIF